MEQNEVIFGRQLDSAITRELQNLQKEGYVGPFQIEVWTATETTPLLKLNVTQESMNFSWPKNGYVKAASALQHKNLYFLFK